MVAPFARRPKGTTNARVVPLARSLAARGHRVTVLIPPYDNPAESGLQETIGGARLVSLRVDAALPEQSPRQAIEQPRLALSLYRRTRALTPDVVHVFKPKAVSGLAQLLFWYMRTGGPRLVLDSDDWEGDGGWNDYERYPWWQKRAADWQERWGLAHAHAFTVASRCLERRLLDAGTPSEKVHYVSNGLEPGDYPGWERGDAARARARLGLGDSPVVLLYTRFFEFAPERAWETFRRIRAARPTARLLVVGAGKFGQERRLTDLAAQDGAPDAVVVAGWQPLDALADLLLTADVALFPADDNLANRAKCSAKVLEVLWLGRAVVADAVGQYAEFLGARDGGEPCGLLAQPERPDELAQAALRVLDDRALAARLGTAGRARVLTEYGWDRLADGVEAAYAAALRAG